jgi:phosphoglycolate phosphatase-like HAD superfamily hydrolase
MKLFVWDFHGVLEHGNHIETIHTVNTALEHCNYTERLAFEDYPQIAHLTLHGYFEFALKKSGFTPNEEELVTLDNLATLLIETGERDLHEHIRQTPHADEVLQTISRHGHQNIVISNSPPPVFQKFLEATSLERHFIIGENAFPVSAHNGFPTIPKPVKLREYLQGKTFNAIIYIGDSQSDLNLHDHFPGIRYLFRHPDYIARDCEADYKISDLRDILREV